MHWTWTDLQVLDRDVYQVLTEELERESREREREQDA